jgi:hypothetical protein
MAVAADALAMVAGAFRASAHIYREMGSPLYAEFCLGGAEDPEILSLADHGMEGAKPSHLFSAVHYLLLRDPADPLARWFATLTAEPLPPAGAFPHLARFCREHRAELAHLLDTRTVQTTYAERCRALLAPMGEVAREAGEPLNLIELGCSAGVLLVFDKFAYDLNGQGVVGPADAPFVLRGELRGGAAELFIPRIGTRTGIDLHTIDVRSEEERRWLLALCFPELRDEQARLAQALDVVAATGIRLLEGDGLAHIDAALAATPDPVCVFHSACLFYWPQAAKLALEERLRAASRTRDIWRISIEPSDTFDDWHKGRPGGEGARQPENRRSGEIAVTCYRDGDPERRVLGYPNADYGIIDWCEREGAA